MLLKAAACGSNQQRLAWGAQPAVGALGYNVNVNVNVNVKRYTVQQKFSEVSVGLCEKLGLESSSELSTTNG